jgi:hypothetical protein
MHQHASGESSRAESSGKPWYGWPEDRFFASGGVDYFTFSSSSNFKRCAPLARMRTSHRDHSAFTRRRTDGLPSGRGTQVQGTAEAGASISGERSEPGLFGCMGASDAIFFMFVAERWRAVYAFTALTAPAVRGVARFAYGCLPPAALRAV